MYAITGITGKVGGALASALLAAGRPVRAVVRNEARGTVWAAKGCELAIADMTDAATLTTAFHGAEAVFILPPSDFDPQPGYPEARKVIDAVVTALAAARPGRVLCLSTIGADAPHDNLLSQRTLMEAALRRLDLPVTFLRPGWFMENAAWDVPAARDEGVLRSFLQPADKAFPMVATGDVGCVAAELIQQSWTGERIVELEGPARVSPNDLAQAFAEALGRPVRVEVAPRETWEDLFREQGMRHPIPRIRMIDGFNEGWIRFGEDDSRRVRGRTSLADVIRGLVAHVEPAQPA
ncbi:NmrA family NAD(P)-binding protein [Sphingomonas oligoaromativorans]|uniref:NmrA family NAD(P)-binding protein n=1 Tax=Sphingomonas oligoaromativorans TaxID=575322 RepID=UPI00141E23D6|nr:NAD(P)H-binding protein [Sphingomonas oligoaromativorans]NIJ33780.1 uncharacterized protein YbjT (DUF2867 family) [Sphingomonas oligoaromativorans]